MNAEEGTGGCIIRPGVERITSGARKLSRIGREDPHAGRFGGRRWRGPVYAFGPILLHLAWAVARAAGGEPAGSGAAEFFETEVRPVLAANCYRCHGPEKQKAGLRLDTRAGLA